MRMSCGVSTVKRALPNDDDGLGIGDRVVGNRACGGASGRVHHCTSALCPIGLGETREGKIGHEARKKKHSQKESHCCPHSCSRGKGNTARSRYDGVYELVGRGIRGVYGSSNFHLGGGSER